MTNICARKRLISKTWVAHIITLYSEKNKSVEVNESMEWVFGFVFFIFYYFIFIFKIFFILILFLFIPCHWIAMLRKDWWDIKDIRTLWESFGM